MREDQLLAFKYSSKDYLFRMSIGTLRAYGRKVGVERPTEKTKNELVDEIVEILTGERIPRARNKKGAPVKNDYVDPAVEREITRLRLKYDIPEKFGDAAVTQEEKEKAHDYIELVRNFHKNRDALELRDSGEAPLITQNNDPECVGQIEYAENGVAYLMPKNAKRDVDEQILVPQDIIDDYGLYEGDVLCCTVKKANISNVVTSVITVNAMDPTVIKRTPFDSADIVYPQERIIFYEETFTQQSNTMKTMQWLVPVRKGQRGCLVGAPKTGKTTFLYDMAKAVRVCNRDVWLFVLLLDQPPETVAQFRKGMEGVDFVAATYEDDCEKQVYAAQFLLKRAKRYAECGKNVLFLVDSFNALARAYNETDASLGGKTLAGGIESKTVYYLKKFLGTARRLENSGSITMIGSLTTETGNPADDLIRSEMCSIANIKIYLDERLALNRIYPNIDLTKTQSIDARYPNEHEKDTFMLCNYLRKEYLPRYDNETLAMILEKAKTYEEVYSKAMRGVREAKKAEKEAKKKETE